MKKQSTHYFALFFFFIFFLFSANTATRAQCIADAGNDTTVCFNPGGSYINIGGSPTASGGVPPYTYTWEANRNYVVGQDTFSYFASDFLNDTTIANPKMQVYSDSLTFFLTVTDSVGNVCKDTINIFCCMYIMKSHIAVHLQAGDSANIYPSVNSSCGGPFKFLWQPDYNISDPTSAYPLVWPDSSLKYTVVITDSRGCQYYDYCEVIVSTVGIKQKNEENFELQIFPNPAKNVLNISYELPFTGKSADFQIYNSLGKKINNFQLPPGEDHIQRDVSELTPGTYFYFMVVDDAIKKKGKFLIAR